MPQILSKTSIFEKNRPNLRDFPSPLVKLRFLLVFKPNRLARRTLAKCVNIQAKWTNLGNSPSSPREKRIFAASKPKLTTCERMGHKWRFFQRNRANASNQGSNCSNSRSSRGRKLALAPKTPEASWACLRGSLRLFP